MKIKERILKDTGYPLHRVLRNSFSKNFLRRNYKMTMSELDSKYYYAKYNSFSNSMINGINEISIADRSRRELSIEHTPVRALAVQHGSVVTSEVEALLRSGLLLCASDYRDS